MQSAITHLFAGVPVSDLDTGIDWYTRFFGRPPDMRVGEEMLWEIDEHAWLFRAERGGAGAGRITLSVNGLDALLERLAAGIEHEPIETYSNGVRHVNVPIRTATRSRSPSRPTARARHLARPKPGHAGADRGLLAAPLARFAGQLIAGLDQHVAGDSLVLGDLLGRHPLPPHSDPVGPRRLLGRRWLSSLAAAWGEAVLARQLARLLREPLLGALVVVEHHGVEVELDEVTDAPQHALRVGDQVLELDLL